MFGGISLIARESNLTETKEETSSQNMITLNYIFSSGLLIFISELYSIIHQVNYFISIS